MSFLDRLLGTQKPVASKTEGLFAMTTAVITLQASLNLVPSDQAAFSFSAIQAADFEALERDIADLLQIRARDTGTQSRMRTLNDDLGYQWAILQTEQFEDLVTTIHVVSEELRSRGYSDRLSFAVFKFTGDNRTVYWIYNYKRGKFYPFVPRGNQQRDNAYELRLATAMERELPVEKELERWYAVWGMPF
jgi:hypothetical protein